jgi:hypothetical protein
MRIKILRHLSRPPAVVLVCVAYKFTMAAYNERGGKRVSTYWQYTDTLVALRLGRQPTVPTGQKAGWVPKLVWTSGGAKISAVTGN